MSRFDRHAEEAEETVLVIDDQGQTYEMVVIYTFAADDHVYAVLLDKHHPDDDGIIMRMEEEDGETVFVHIEDDEEWDRAVNTYNEIVNGHS